MEDLIRRSGFAYQKELEAELLPKAVKGNEVDSPAYTVRFTNGTMKGKTPAQVLAEDPGNGSDALNRQYKWLQSNRKHEITCILTWKGKEPAHICEQVLNFHLLDATFLRDTR